MPGLLTLLLDILFRYYMPEKYLKFYYSYNEVYLKKLYLWVDFCCSFSLNHRLWMRSMHRFRVVNRCRYLLKNCIDLINVSYSSYPYNIFSKCSIKKYTINFFHYKFIFRYLLKKFFNTKQWHYMYPPVISKRPRAYCWFLVLKYLYIWLLLDYLRAFYKTANFKKILFSVFFFFTHQSSKSADSIKLISWRRGLFNFQLLYFTGGKFKHSRIKFGRMFNNSKPESQPKPRPNRRRVLLTASFVRKFKLFLKQWQQSSSVLQNSETTFSDMISTKSLVLPNKRFFFLRYNKLYNKGRYSRNRQTYRTGVFWCLWLTVIALYGAYYYYYGFLFKFSSIWWFIFIIFFFFTFSFFRRKRDYSWWWWFWF